MRHSLALKLTFVLGVILMWTAPAGAVPTPFSLVGVNDPTLSADVLFSYDPGSATVSIDITNTSVVPPDGDPRFTAFAFNVPGNVSGISTFTFPDPPGGWRESFSPDSINTNGQYGLFDIAGLTGPNFNGGSASVGIPAAERFSFSFALTGVDLGILDESDFLGELSASEPGQTYPQYFIGRFQRTGPGPEPSGSDVAIPPVRISEPVSLVLFGSGLTGLWWTRRRRS
jgi:hypothetical protein